MKPRYRIAIFIFIVVMVGVWQFHPWRAKPAVKDPGPAKPIEVRQPETPAEREARWTREAKTAFAAAITNDLPGHKRTIRTEDNIVSGQPVTNWSASAVVEYVDKNGNFGRTTLFWKFQTNADNVHIIPVSY